MKKAAAADAPKKGKRGMKNIQILIKQFSSPAPCVLFLAFQPFVNYKLQTKTSEKINFNMLVGKKNKK